MKLSLPIGSPCVPIEAHLLILLLLYSVVACSKFSQYLSILKGYGASKTSRLYHIVEKLGGENVYEFSFSQCLAKKLLILCTNLNGFSLANHR